MAANGKTKNYYSAHNFITRVSLRCTSVSALWWSQWYDHTPSWVFPERCPANESGSGCAFIKYPVKC